VSEAKKKKTARMSFTDIEHIDQLENWFNDSNVLLYRQI